MTGSIDVIVYQLVRAYAMEPDAVRGLSSIAIIAFKSNVHTLNLLFLASGPAF